MGRILAQDPRVRVAMAETASVRIGRSVAHWRAGRGTHTGMAGSGIAGPYRSGGSRAIHASQEHIRAVFQL